MPQPFLNLDEVTLDEREEHGFFTSAWANVSERIGARQLGYNLTELPPGKASCPFHSHHGEEEMFLILAGEGQLRFGAERYPVRRHDIIACPTGGAEVAHQLINTGTAPLRYLALSNRVTLEACEYPDSGKVLVSAGPRGARTLSKLFRAGTAVDYYDGEDGPARDDRPTQPGE